MDKTKKEIERNSSITKVNSSVYIHTAYPEEALTEIPLLLERISLF